MVPPQAFYLIETHDNVDLPAFIESVREMDGRQFRLIKFYQISEMGSLILLAEFDATDPDDADDKIQEVYFALNRITGAAHVGIGTVEADLMANQPTCPAVAD